jgi:HPt (histidine-containing phosphotransfer) domain-containing protein
MLAEADQETVEIIAGIFLETWPKDIERLRQALPQADFATFERTAHSLKGALATFGPSPAVNLAAELENQATKTALSGLLPQINALESELKSLTPLLQAIVDRISG